MELVVNREFKGLTCTIGSLFVNDQFECYTLEDVVREIPGKPVSSWKIYGQTAIPRGRYEVDITMSPHFGYATPELLNVPGYTGVRIHPGNTDRDTDGCILVGDTKDEHGEFIGNSRDAWEKLMVKIKAAIAAGEKVYITI